jgi:hypothetical protein
MVRPSHRRPAAVPETRSVAEKITSEQIAAQRHGAESNLQVEGAKIRVGQSHRMDDRLDRESRGRGEWQSTSPEQVQPDRRRQRAVKQRALSPRVQIRDHISGPRQLMWSADRDRQNRERSASGAPPVRELVRVCDGWHASQTEVCGRLYVRRLDIEDERHLDALAPCAGDDAGGVLAVCNEILALQDDPLAGQATHLISVRLNPLQLALPMRRLDHLLALPRRARPCHRLHHTVLVRSFRARARLHQWCGGQARQQGSARRFPFDAYTRPCVY